MPELGLGEAEVEVVSLSLDRLSRPLCERSRVGGKELRLSVRSERVIYCSTATDITVPSSVAQVVLRKLRPGWSDTSSGG